LTKRGVRKMDRDDSRFWGKILSIAIALAMIMSGMVFVVGDAASENVDGPEKSAVETPTTMVGGDGEVYLVDICAPPYYRPAFTDKDNQLELRIKNNGDFFEFVKVSLYHIEPDGENESYLKTVWVGIIFSGQEKVRNAFGESEDMWQPTERGRNWIRGEI
jgi:hypothetical protein